MPRSVGATALSGRAAKSNTDDEAFFMAIDAQVDAASLCSRRGRLRQAAAILRRAYGIASAKLRAGSRPVPARVARACIGVQYCALLSRLGQHAEALDEALAAAVDTEAVWQALLSAEEARNLVAGASSMQGARAEDIPFALLMRKPPRWLERAATASVQARHCVALELEFTMQGSGVSQDPEFDVEARWEMIAALHREGAWLAAKLLPNSPGMSELSKRAEAQAARRRVEAHARPQKPAERPSAQFLDDGVSEDQLPEPGAAFWEEVYGQELDDAVSTADGAPPQPVAASSRQGSLGKENRRPASAPCLVTCAVSKAQDGSRPGADDKAQGDSKPRVAAQPRKPSSSPAARGFRHECPSPIEERGIRGKRSAPIGSEGASKTERQCIFADWLHGAGLDRLAIVHRKLSSDDGLKELQEEMRNESLWFKHHVLACLSPEELWQNSKVYSHYGQQVYRQAERRDVAMRENRRLTDRRPGSAPAVAPAPGRQQVSPSMAVGATAADGHQSPEQPPALAANADGPLPSLHRNNSMPACSSRSSSRPASAAAGGRCRGALSPNNHTSASGPVAAAVAGGGSAGGGCIYDVRGLRKALQRSFVETGVRCGYLSQDHLSTIAAKRKPGRSTTVRRHKELLSSLLAYPVKSSAHVVR